VTPNITVEVQTALPACDAEQIIRALVGYNVTQAPPANHRILAVVARRAGEIVGGLLGYTHWEWLFIQQLWVADTFRRRGLGRSLMRAAEQEACRRGCRNAHCDTYDFQALSFYQKLGYHIFGQLEDYPAGHTRYFLQKRTLDETGIT